MNEKKMKWMKILNEMNENLQKWNICNLNLLVICKNEMNENLKWNEIYVI